jgi:hypothetical protein
VYNVEMDAFVGIHHTSSSLQLSRLTLQCDFLRGQVLRSSRFVKSVRLVAEAKQGVDKVCGAR